MDKIQTAEEFSYVLEGQGRREDLIRSRDRAIVERCKNAVWQTLYGKSSDEAMRRADTLGGEIVSAIDYVLRELEGKEVPNV